MTNFSQIPEESADRMRTLKSLHRSGTAVTSALISSKNGRGAFAMCGLMQTSLAFLAIKVTEPDSGDFIAAQISNLRRCADLIGTFNQGVPLRNFRVELESWPNLGDKFEATNCDCNRNGYQQLLDEVEQQFQDRITPFYLISSEGLLSKVV